MLWLAWLRQQHPCLQPKFAQISFVACLSRATLVGNTSKHVAPKCNFFLKYLFIGLGAGRDWGRGTDRKVVDPGRWDYLWGNHEFGGLESVRIELKKIRLKVSGRGP